MKYILGILIALGISMVLTLLLIILNFEYENWAFFIGWLSCTGYMAGIRFYEIKHIK